MNSSIFLPRRIRVGFQARNDTYTKKLAYVIYYDEKNKIRKEASWESWRDHAIKPVEYDNEPTEGFVLNKKVGGYAGDWGDFRQAYVRVYDPRGFEFEITVPNLLYILEHTSSIKGKGLEGQFVYGWDGTDLVLIPVCSPDYAALSELNSKRFENHPVKAKELVVGAEYLTKRNERCIYMGRFDYYDHGYYFDGKFFSTFARLTSYASSVGKAASVNSNNIKYDCGTDEQRFFFCYPNEKDFDGSTKLVFKAYRSISGLLIDTLSDHPVEEFASIFDKLEHCELYSPLDKEKDETVPYTVDELADGVSQRGYLIVMTDIGEISIGYENDEYDIRTYSKALAERLKQHFPNNRISSDYRRMISNVKLTDVVEKLHPTYTNQYLKNGNFYRRAN